MIRRLLVVVPLLLPLPAAAGALSDLLMAPRLFGDEPVGASVGYAEERTVPGEGSLEDVAGGEVRLEVVATADGRELRLVREKDGRPVPVGTFPAGTANPVLLYFLETTVRGMAEATGGSPYYIRNRIREALAASGLGEGEPREVTLAPFAADPNRARMGGFADLAIRLRFDPARPARILELSADTPDGAEGYHERLVLIAED
jgi:hypothetical protein